jgi:hypothetical protein
LINFDKDWCAIGFAFFIGRNQKQSNRVKKIILKKIENNLQDISKRPFKAG